MVWTKACAKVYFSFYPGPFDSNSDSNSEWVVMGTKASTSDSDAIRKLTISKIFPRKVPCTPEGYWVDVPNYFISKSVKIENKWYYRNISSGYAKHPNSGLGKYDEAKFDRIFAGIIVSKVPNPLKDEYAALDHAVRESSIQAALQLDSRIQWRLPLIGVKIYHRPLDEFVPVWLEHLSSESSLPLSFGNTSSLWYKIRFQDPECGYGSGFRSVIQQSPLKHWNGEIILLKDLDLFYFPYRALDGVQTSDALLGLGTAFKQRKKATVVRSGSLLYLEEGSLSNDVSKPDSEEENRGSDHAVDVEDGEEFENLDEIELLVRFLKLSRKGRTSIFGPKILILPGVLGASMAGAAAITYYELKHLRELLSIKNKDLGHLKAALSNKDNTISGLNQNLSDVANWAKTDEKECDVLQNRVRRDRYQNLSAEGRSDKDSS
ncbi:hypothetical protein AgCh_021810 [Apium graveolens]